MAMDGFHKSIHSIDPVGGTIGIILAIFSLLGVIGYIQKITAAMKDQNSSLKSQSLVVPART